MFRTLLALGAVLLLVYPSVSLSASCPLECESQVLFVGGSGPGNFSRIQDAIDNATAGDTVFVYSWSSPYTENLIVDKPLRLVGENRSMTQIIGNATAKTMQIVADNVMLEEFTISSLVMPPSGLLNVVEVFGNHTVIDDNTFLNVSVEAEYGSITISRNSFLHVREWATGFPGAVEVFMKHCLVENNSFVDCTFGVWIIGCSESEIRNNSFDGCTNGIYCGLPGFSLVIQGNNIMNCSTGLEFNGGNSTITGNVVTGCENGIVVYLAMWSKFTRNSVNHCTWAFSLQDSRFCRYLNNDLIAYAGDAYVLNSLGNTWSHNYWNESSSRPHRIILHYNYWLYGLPGCPELRFNWWAFERHPAQTPNQR